MSQTDNTPKPQTTPSIVLPRGWQSPDELVERIARAISRGAGYDPDRVYCESYDQFTQCITDRRPNWMHHVKEAVAVVAEMEIANG